MSAVIYPAVFLPFAAGILCYIAGRKSERLRNFIAIAACAAETALFVYMLLWGGDAFCELNFYLGRLSFRLDGFRTMYALIASFMWLLTTVFSTPYFASYTERDRYYLFSMLTFGATLGVFLSDDLLTTFVFFEIMSLTSYVMVVHDRKENALRAASTYLAVAVTGGLVMLMGLLLAAYHYGGSPSFEALSELDGSSMYIPCLLMLFGFGAKAGAFPLHVWLPKAHPAAPAPASALLSGILTKAGVFGMLVLTADIMRGSVRWGRALLVIGVITMVLGGILALLSCDIKRTLACSSMSQIGFITVGAAMTALLGDENAVAAGGTVLHMVNHSLIKLVLFICAGVIYMNIHKLGLNDIRGFGRGKPFLTAVFALGAFDICGIPPFGGYISKTLLHESILEYAAGLSGAEFYAVKGVEYLFLFTGGLTVAYMTKLFICVFVSKPADEAFVKIKKYIPVSSAILLGLSALILPSLGIFTSLSEKIASVSAPFLGNVPLPDISFFSAENLFGAFISVTVGAAVYFFVVRRRMTLNGAYFDYTNPRCDLDEAIYKPLMYRLLPGLFGAICEFISELPVYISKAAFKTAMLISHILSDLLDLIILAVRRTFLREVKVREPDVLHAKTTSKIGLALQKGMEKLEISGKTSHLDMRFAAVAETVRVTMRRISRNLSFAMIMSCIGICAALIFLLFIN